MENKIEDGTEEKVVAFTKYKGIDEKTGAALAAVQVIYKNDELDKIVLSGGSGTANLTHEEFLFLTSFAEDTIEVNGK